MVLVSDVVGTCFFGMLLAWNLTIVRDNEVTAILTAAILGHVAFEIFFSEVSSRCTPHPWRDLRDLLSHRVFLIYTLNMAATYYLAHVLPYHLLPLERLGG